MTKYLITCFIVLSSLVCRADFIDKMEIFVNGKTVFNMTLAQSKVLYTDSLQVGDTLTFVAETDWDDLFNATIDLKREDGQVITLTRIPNNFAGAMFQLVVTKELLEHQYSFRFDYHVGHDIEPWDFLVTKRKEID